MTGSSIILPLSAFSPFAFFSMMRSLAKKGDDRSVVYVQDEVNQKSHHSLILLKSHLVRCESMGQLSIPDSERDRLLLLYKNKSGNHDCYYCKKETDNANFDHFIPLYLGGTDSYNNLRISCKSCNLMKGSIHPFQMPISWASFNTHLKESTRCSAMTLLERVLEDDLGEEESKLAKKLLKKEYEWRIARGFNCDKKSIAS